jgi:hypothetical protein
MQEFIELGQGYFARAIERRMAGLSATSEMPASRRSAIAQSYAGAFFSLLSWWLAQASPPSPAEMDAMFHQMFWSGVRAEAGPPNSSSK